MNRIVKFCGRIVNLDNVCYIDPFVETRGDQYCVYIKFVGDTEPTAFLSVKGMAREQFDKNLEEVIKTFGSYVVTNCDQYDKANP
jgi:hypothetical protein